MAIEIADFAREPGLIEQAQVAIGIADPLHRFVVGRCHVRKRKAKRSPQFSAYKPLINAQTNDDLMLVTGPQPISQLQNLHRRMGVDLIRLRKFSPVASYFWLVE